MVLPENKKILGSISKEQLVRQIQSFGNLDQRQMSYEDVQREILKAISLDLGGGRSETTLLRKPRVIPAGSTFFRVRYMGEDMNVIKTKMCVSDHAWSPKPEHVQKLGRLNKVSEPLLYVAA
ncbi:hypothetical protein [Dyadobacter sp. 22481]|uniref:hypothetical protein n=1 Tax=Dyadobacter sp. 22481 TaxID=3453926 RepID=UPI003F83F2B5